MPHWWNEPLTLYRKQESKDENGRRQISWKRQTLKNCFARDTMVQTFNGGQVLFSHHEIFRVPADQCDMFAIGDIIMIGDIPEAVPPMTEGNTFILEEVRDNSKLINAHFYGRSGAL